MDGIKEEVARRVQNSVHSAFDGYGREPEYEVQRLSQVETIIRIQTHQGARWFHVKVSEIR